MRWDYGDDERYHFSQCITLRPLLQALLLQLNKRNSTLGIFLSNPTISILVGKYYIVVVDPVNKQQWIRLFRVITVSVNSAAFFAGKMAAGAINKRRLQQTQYPNHKHKRPKKQNRKPNISPTHTRNTHSSNHRNSPQRPQPYHHQGIYQWYGKNRNEKGGGVGFLIRNDIGNITEEHEPNSNNNSEHKWITIKGRSN